MRGSFLLDVGIDTEAVEVSLHVCGRDADRCGCQIDAGQGSCLDELHDERSRTSEDRLHVTNAEEVLSDLGHGDSGSESRVIRLTDPAALWFLLSPRPSDPSRVARRERELALSCFVFSMRTYVR